VKSKILLDSLHLLHYYIANLKVSHVYAFGKVNWEEGVTTINSRKTWRFTMKKPFRVIGGQAKRVKHYKGCTNSRFAIHVVMYMYVYMDIHEA